MKPDWRSVRHPDSIPRKTAFSLRCSAAILLQLSPRAEAHFAPSLDREHNRIRFQTVRQEQSWRAVFVLEVIPIPCPHFQITITQRSKGQSAVAGAAYQSGEKLFSEYDQKTKNYSGKRGILYTEIMLPSHAPPEYANRETLWNSVENAEKQWNAQLARRFVLALPKEVPPEQYPQMIRDYCEKQFVSKGMIADFAIHDPAPPGHNVHCHVMLTLRAMDETGKWLPKSRKVYDLDENGERIRLPSGNWKSHKEDTVD